MAKLNEITDIIERIAPFEKQENWDNSGWQIRLNKKNIARILLCVSVTNNILKQALTKKCDMIIAHHPLFFNGEYDKEISRDLIRYHMPVYSIHTPFDKAVGGTTDILIDACGFCIDEVLNDYTKIYYADMTLKELTHRIKKGLGIDKLRITNYNPKTVVKKVAFCAGSGTSFCEDVIKTGCDCFVTADLKYHCAVDSDITIIDVGHLESEKPALSTLKELLKDVVEVEIADEKSPVEII